MMDKKPDYDHPHFWMRQADGDMAMARAHGDGLLPEHRLFHIQQAVEKALKGVLVARGLPYSRTHNIRVLISELRTGGVAVPEEAEDAESFTQYESLTRYPVELSDEDLEITEEHCEVAAEIAEAVLEWAKAEILK